MSTSHFASDGELLERFVLGRLDPSERERLNEHLRTCESCREAVQTERTIAAGVRRFGRESVKDRVRARIARPERSAIAWPQVLSAAAAILVIIGVGIYGHWFSTTVVEEALKTDQRSSRNAPAASSGAEQPSVAERRVEESSKPARPPEHAARNAVKPSRPDAALADRGAGTGLTAREKETHGRIAAAPATGRDLKMAAPPETVASGTHEPTSGTQEYWTTGIRLQESIALDETGVVKGKSEALMQKADKDNLRSGGGAKKTAATQQAMNMNELAVTISQQPLSSLPVRQQQLQARLSVNSVQTLVQQRDHRLAMTLYLDSLVNERDLKNASVSPVSEDSLVISLANQKIGYHLQQPARSEKRNKR